MKVLSVKKLTETTPFTGYCTAITCQNKIFIKSNNNTIYEYNPLTRTFTQLGVYTLGTLIVINDVIYSLESRSQSYYRYFDIYKINGLDFGNKTLLGTQSIYSGSISYIGYDNDNIYYLRASSSMGSTIVYWDIYSYNLTNNTWTQTSKGSGGTWSFNNNYTNKNIIDRYILTGQSGTNNNTRYQYYINNNNDYIGYYKNNDNEFVSLYNNNNSKVDNLIYIIGGTENLSGTTIYSKKISTFNTNTKELKYNIAELIENQEIFGCCTLNDKIYCFAGYSQNTATNIIQVLEFTDYDLTYNIAKNSGEIYETLEHLAPIESMRVNVDGDSVGVILNTLGGQVTTSYTSEAPSGYKLIGYGFTQGTKRVVIPVNKDITIRINESATFYEVYGKFTPIDTPVDMVLYNNSSESNRVDKSNYLTEVTTLRGTLRESTSLLTPSIKIYLTSLPAFNYVYIQAFNRYYYVTNITSVRMNLWQIDLKTDVLMSYKDSILLNTAIINRTADSNYIDNLLNDNMALAQAIPSQEVIDLDTTNAELTFNVDATGSRLAVSLVKARGVIVS